MKELKEWQLKAIDLATTTNFSWRRIAEIIGKSKSTVSDFLRDYFSELDNEIPEINITTTIIPQGPKVLCLDIETLPLGGALWSLWDGYISLSQIERDWSLLSYAAKWCGGEGTIKENDVAYLDIRDKEDVNDDKEILQELWNLLDECDIVLTKNGKRFDIKKINARFVMQGMKPPSHYAHIDLEEVIKRNFGFTSRKLEYVAEKLNVEFKKLDHKNYAGYKLWKACLQKELAAFVECEEYNKHDVLATEELLYKLMPWDQKLPKFSLYTESEQFVCNCGSHNIVKVGYCYTGLSKFTKFQCEDCGASMRDRTNLLSKEKRKNILVNIAQ